ncbi:uncharacterized protein RHO25_008577 [Cercospora beticola]|uniref:Uracil-DNA glycosylase-like domain-containing protein n=1 Tax=Cercospora beticola TaxID=122368 RepID=A0ABZ0NWF1_CERBT|nr:hypothetical protein RHO25_008577 [Cercospora beticola]CAK1357277.1 unnamed protein product [Cercospora beticola]
MIDFYAELAEPATTGGAVVILERPSTAERLRYGGGYDTVLSKTKTLREVKRLVSMATNKAMSIHDVTIWDAFPLQPKDNFNNQDAKKSSKLLYRLLCAKRPDLVISCFRAGKHEGVITNLQHPGVGNKSNNQYYPFKVDKDQHQFKKIDAFHPSFAISYHPKEDCFIQLL